MTTSHPVPSDQAGSLRPRPASACPDLQIITSPPCRPGPCARALTRTAWTRPCPPDPAGTHCPTRFQPGPRDPPGARPVLPTASRPGRRGQDSRYHHRAILGVCVPHPPEKAIVDVLVPAPSRCRHVPRWGCWGGLVGLRLPRVRPLRPGPGTSSTPTRDAGLSAARGSLPGGEHLQRWAGSIPPTLLLSDWGRKWGPNPLGSIEQTMEGTSGECASSVSRRRAGGTPGWLLNLCSGTWRR